MLPCINLQIYKVCRKSKVLVWFVTLHLSQHYGNVRTVSSPNHSFFFLGKLDQAVNQYFMHLLLLVTDNNPS